MEQIRIVSVPGGTITYTLVKKRIKNLNLRLNDRGEVTVSVPHRCPVAQADEFVRRKSGWILDHLAKRNAMAAQPLLPELDRCAACELLRQALLRAYPLVRRLGVAMPELRVRKMRSQWGNCHWAQGYITLNLALHRCPEPLRDYVALHELVHFLHHDHGPGFYQAMDVLMPDWRERRKQLKQYGTAVLG